MIYIRGTLLHGEWSHRNITNCRTCLPSVSAICLIITYQLLTTYYLQPITYHMATYLYITTAIYILTSYNLQHTTFHQPSSSHMTTAQHKRNHTITHFTLLFVCTGCIPISYYMFSVMLHQIIFWSLDAVRHCYLCTTFNSSLWIKSCSMHVVGSSHSSIAPSYTFSSSSTGSHSTCSLHKDPKYLSTA